MKRYAFHGEKYDWFFDLMLLPVALVTTVAALVNSGRK